MKIKHITIRVKDLEESIRFYEIVTELKVARRFKSGPAELAFMANNEGDTEVELLHIPEGQTFEGKGMFICFETSKLDEMHEVAKSHGLNPSDIQVPGDGTRYFYVYDPNGVSIQLRTF
jgi:lactoylglutathione lyase